MKIKLNGKISKVPTAVNTGVERCDTHTPQPSHLRCSGLGIDIRKIHRMFDNS